MKTRMTLLLAGLFSMAAVSAQALTTDDIISAIDGEYSPIQESMVRVNYSLTTPAADPLDHILQGIDGEFVPFEDVTSRANFMLDSDSMMDSMTERDVLDHVLSGVDGLYDRAAH